MQATFSRHFKDGMFDSWEPSFVFGEAGISACNRYFQHRGETLPDEVVPFGEHVDPNHMLEAAAEGSYCHTINNHAEYYEHMDGLEGSQRYADPLWSRAVCVADEHH